ncbi:hypothetical protein [Hymenobacter metallilatus]|uniref:Uncharacterized protein n=1 Tax=Hymenobacter metallilatus TaxID=2493666 RepID=A0A428IYQ9_9BACT|nr:hypothetical protein [Hymenobacter metallilatus]RSK24211.1 hypothetical protein EI290_20745 [Hymenobacter metallilatus]
MHDGEDLERAVSEAGMSIGRFAKAMNAERNTPRRWFGMPVLPTDRREEAAKVLRTTPEAIFKRLAKKEGSASAQLPETPLSQSSPRNTAQEPMQQYGSIENSADMLRCMEERDKWQRLAYEHLSKYNELLVEHNQLLRLARLGTTNLSTILSH